MQEVHAPATSVPPPSRRASSSHPDRKETPEELTRSRDLLGAVLDYAPGFIIAVAADGRIRFINRVLPQHDMKDVIGAQWLQYMPPDQHDALRKWFADVLATGAAQTYETSVLGPNGDLVWLTTHMGPMRDGDRIVGAILVAQEITELRRTQLEFAGAQRMAAIGTLAAGIAHEINTPVQFVGDSLHFLHEGMDDLLSLLDTMREACRVAALEPPSAAMATALATVTAAEKKVDLPYLREALPPAFHRCVDGLGRVASIVSSVREFAHPAQTEMAPSDLNRAIENTLTIARSEYVDVAELKTYFGKLPPVTCRVDQINQVVLNLVVNATQAIASVVKDSGAKGELVVRTWTDNTDVVISVSDTGPGIPEKLRERIFEPFFTTKEVGKGTGQGLALAWKFITERHGGTLTYETKLGEGTTFLVRLPCAGKK